MVKCRKKNGKPYLENDIYNKMKNDAQNKIERKGVRKIKLSMKSNFFTNFY